MEEAREAAVLPWLCESVSFVCVHGKRRGVDDEGQLVVPWSALAPYLYVRQSCKVSLSLFSHLPPPLPAQHPHFYLVSCIPSADLLAIQPSPSLTPIY